MTNVYSIMGLISTIFIFLPVLLIIVLKMAGHRNFIALLVYYILALGYNVFTLNYISVSADVITKYGLINNLLDAPIMLFFISYFGTCPKIKRIIRFFIPVYILFEVVVVLINGLNTKTMAIVIGPGLFTVIGFTVHFFLQQTKRAIRSPKANGKALLTASLIFSYGCYIFLYLMFYVFKTHIENGVINQQSVADTYLLYYICTILSSAILCAGLIMESKRVQQLFEMKVTRRELSTIYTNKKAATPFRAALLDFDKDLLH